MVLVVLPHLFLRTFCRKKDTLLIDRAGCVEVRPRFLEDNSATAKKKCSALKGYQGALEVLLDATVHFMLLDTFNIWSLR